MSENSLTRRQALGAGVALITGYSPAKASQGPKPTPLKEIVLIREFASNAKLALPDSVFATIRSDDHGAFDRITFRPRLMIPTLNLDLSTKLFGQKLFAPILIGATADQKRYHPEAELATLRGAAAGNTTMVISSHSSLPIDRIAKAATAPLWYQVDLEPAAKDQIGHAASLGCKVACVTLGPAPQIDWTTISRLAGEVRTPLLVRGILSPEEAKMALQNGAQGIIVAARARSGPPAPISVLPSVVDAVGEKMPVLIEDNFQLGTDVIKALAFGAKGVLVTHPPMWGLAAYGADGVQTVVEMFQTELGRAMAMCGNPNVPSLDRSRLKVHAS